MFTATVTVTGRRIGAPPDTFQKLMLWLAGNMVREFALQRGYDLGSNSHNKSDVTRASALDDAYFTVEITMNRNVAPSLPADQPDSIVNNFLVSAVAAGWIIDSAKVTSSQ